MHLEGVLIEDRSRDTLLYARDVQVRITDWFFIRKQAVLKYIRMEDAIVKFQRTHSTWRQQFIFSYFTSPSSGKKKKAGINFDLKIVELKNVAFIKKDAWLGEDMVIKVGQLNMDAKMVDISEKIFDINNLSLVNPVFSIYHYKKLKPDIEKIRIADSIKTERLDSLLKWNSNEWVIQLDKLKIENGLFSTDRQTDIPVLSGFDGNHIRFSNINGELTGTRLIRDTIYAHLELKTKERSGFEVKKLVADLRMAPEKMAFTNLIINTNRSTIGDYFEMSFDNFSDMGDFIHKVKMQANFTGSEIDSDDIAYFAPTLNQWKKKITLHGKVRGTVDNIIGKEMKIKAGNNTLLNGDISLIGLPAIEQTFINFTANEFKTTYSDAVIFIPALRKIKTPDLKKFNSFIFSGSFTGFIRDFVTDGTIRTNLGTVVTDLNMKLPYGKQPIYSGKISTSNFRMGEFLNDSSLGSISLDGIVAGTGFSENTRNTTLKGEIHFVDYKKYRYTNINVNGHLKQQLFDGFASIKDPNADLNLTGLFDLSRENSAFDVLINVNNINLQKINLTEKDLSVKGNFKLNFTGRNIDEFTGKASIKDASILSEGQRLPFDSLIINSRLVNGQKNLTVNSNEFDAGITGNFRIKELPDAFRLFLNKYYPSYITSPEPIPENQNFTFEVEARNVHDYMKLIHKDLGGFDYSRVSGKLNLSENQLELDAEVPDFTFKQFVFSNAEITGNGTLEKLLLKGKAGNIIINDSIILPESSFSIEAANDISKINISTTANQPINKAKLNAIVQTFQDGVLVQVDTSSFSLNGKPWVIDKDGSLDFRKTSIAAGKLVLRSGDQEIKLQTEPSKKGNWNDLNVLIKNLNVGDLSPFIMPKNRLEGIVSGTAIIEDPFVKFNIISDLKAEQLLLDNDTLGNITAHLEYDNTAGQLIANGKNLDSEHKINFNLNLFLKDKEKAKLNRISTNMINYPINILERFLGELFSNVEGFITGPVEMTGPIEELNFSGKPRLMGGGLKVKFTQCFYKIQDTEIELKPKSINLNGIVLIDPVSGNPVYLSGNIEHHSFKNLFFDVLASTRKPFTTDALHNKPVLLINTTVRDNPQFYGRAIGTGLFSLTGPESEIFMKIDAIASSKDSSYVTIPSSTRKESGFADFLVERKYGREMSELGSKKGTSNIIYDVDLVITPAVNLKVVLDEVTNDQIKGRGEGVLSIHSGTSEPLQMRGRFNILDGNYLFTFQSLFKRPFVLRKGADNYIEWKDDPLDAKIHFDAIYTADNVSFAPLVTALNLDPSLNKYREDVYVVANLTGNLFSPDFKFSLEFPPNSKAKNDPSFNFNIQQLENNPNLINRQVTYLIVFNSFAPPETGNSTSSSFGSAINELAYSTISSLSGLLFNQVNRELNKALSKILKTDNVSINFSGSVYNRNLLEQQGKNSFNVNQGNLDINLPISLFKDRFVITLGSTLDVPLESTIERNIQFLPDVSAEWLINQSGTVRATFFYRQDLDILTSNSSGADEPGVPVPVFPTVKSLIK